MIKAIYYKTQQEKNNIKLLLIEKGISIFNTFFHKNKNLISWFENEDYQNTNMGFNYKGSED
jgi:hypothetical protein